MVTIQKINARDLVKPSRWEVYLHCQEGPIEAMGEPAKPESGYIPDLHYELENIYQRISTTKPGIPVDEIYKKAFQGKTESFKDGTVTITFNRDKDEGHVKGAKFESPIKSDLEKFLDEISENFRIL